MKSDNDRLLEDVAGVLIRCFWIGFVFLMLWAVLFIGLGDLIYKVHSSMYDMTRGQFDIIHYCGMLAVKSFVFLVFLMPYIGIKLVQRKKANG